MSFYNKSFKFAATLLFSSSLLTTAVIAAEPAVTSTPSAPAAQNQSSPSKIDENTVLATVNDKNITYHDIQNMRKMLPDQYKSLPAPVLTTIILQQLIVQNAVLQVAEKQNLQNSPEVKQQIEFMQKDILFSTFQKSELEKNLKQNPIDDKAIQTFYDQHFANAAPVKEAHICHILVKTQPEAVKIISQLHAGKNFANLAKQYSTDKESGSENGGDLGWVKQNDPLAPEFINAAFALKANTITTAPVKTQFGWHVIKVLGYRNAPVPPLDKVKDEIRKNLYQQRMKTIIENVIKQSKITKNDEAIHSLTQMPATQKK